jgi:LuxR family maltose regulon positive regulatory protein
MPQVQLLQTKLHIPPVRPELVSRPRLIERLNLGLDRKLTVISAPAGYGKTTLLSEWVARCEEREPKVRAAWLSLDEEDSDPTRFLVYLVAALQTIAPHVGAGVLGTLQSPQPAPIAAMLTALLNDITAISDQFILVLDDYHVIDSQAVDAALTFLLEHLPQPPLGGMHLVIASREDPHLPLAQLRARGQLTELRVGDLRFTSSEAAGFLNQVMGLGLSTEDIAALEVRTEGWIAGLQLAALALQGTISVQGHESATSFVRSFTGSHRFVLDYLLEEVLERQPKSVQAFLLHTSILDRLCGPLCDAVFRSPTASGQEILEYLDRANLFTIPLDNERRWYRYHHLFAELLRQRLQRSSASSTGDEGVGGAEYRDQLHVRASQWYEDNGLPIEAFHHAAAANDVERAGRLIRGERIPQHFRGAVTAVLDWLESLPKTVLDARPWLWWRYASLLLVSGQTTGVEEKLQAAEAALPVLGPDTEPDLSAVEGPDDETRNLIGLIAAARATLALTRYDPEAMLAQSHRALEYLHPDSLLSRASANWTLGHAYLLQGKRAAACQAFTAAISISQTAGDTFTTILAAIGLGNVQERENQLYQAAETYQRVLQLAGDQPLQIIGEAHLGLARVLYEWNDLDGAEQHGQQGLELARQYESVIDRFISCEVFLARLKLAQGDVADATKMLARADQSVRQHGFVHRTQEVAAAEVLAFLHQGDLAAAAHLAGAHELPISQAQVHLARKDASAALAAVEPVRQQAEAEGWADEKLKVAILRAIAYHILGQNDEAARLLDEALAMARPSGFVRIFVDEGPRMAQLLSEAAARGIRPEYIGKLQAAFVDATKDDADASIRRTMELTHSSLIEPLSKREIEVLQLIAEGLTNQQVADRLYLSLHTIKVHARNIYGKLGVKNRTQAVAKGRALGILIEP